MKAAPHIRLAAGIGMAVLCAGATAQVVSGTIDGWADSTFSTAIGDGTNFLNVFWSQASAATGTGFFYGWNNHPVALATGVTSIEQIVDASTFSFTTETLGPLCDPGCGGGVAPFVVWRNPEGYYGVLRVDDIAPDPVVFGVLSGTWWFQSDGSASFASVVPEPATQALWLIGALALAGARLRRRG